MADVHKFHQLLGGAEAVGGGVVPGDLVAPGGLVGVLHDGKKLNMGVAHVLAVGGELPPELHKVEVGAVFMALPGAGVHLVDVEGALQALGLGDLAAVGGVVPDEALQRADAAGGLRQGAALGAVGIHFHDGIAVLRGDGVLIRLTLLGIDRKSLPDTIADHGHWQIFQIPEVEVTHDADGFGIGGPNPEEIACMFLANRSVAAQNGKSTAAFAGLKCFELRSKCFIHGQSLILCLCQNCCFILYHFCPHCTSKNIRKLKIYKKVPIIM